MPTADGLPWQCPAGGLSSLANLAIKGQLPLVLPGPGLPMWEWQVCGRSCISNPGLFLVDEIPPSDLRFAAALSVFLFNRR